MRKLLAALTLALVVAIAVPIALAAGPTRAAGQLDRQQAAWTADPVSNSSPQWRTIRRLSFVSSQSVSNTLCAKHELSVSLSVGFHGGAPVLFRVLMDGGPTLEPGPAHFLPGSGSRTHAATFVGNAGTFEGSDRHALEVQWRSPSGEPVTLDRGVANVLFEQGSSC